MGPHGRGVADTLELNVQRFRLADWATVRPLWDELSAISRSTSFFLSGPWVTAWLGAFGPTLNPEILIFFYAEEPVGACLLVRRVVRRGPFLVRRVHLNTAGEDPDESACIELNGLLSRPGFEGCIAQTLRRGLDGTTWDEFAADGLAGGESHEALLTAFADLPIHATSVSNYYIDLNGLRQSGRSYEDAVLSHNSRRQVRRSLRMYAQGGAVQLDSPQTTDDALTMLDDMMALHQAAWSAVGQPGAFASTRFVSMHRALIREAFPQGGIQLLRLMARGRPVGILYNFVRNDRVFCYQFGLSPADDNRLKPGLSVNVCAINHCLQRGFSEYDLSAGEQRYKKSLARDRREMAWLVIEHPTAKMRLIRWLRCARLRWWASRKRPAEGVPSEPG